MTRIRLFVNLPTCRTGIGEFGDTRVSQMPHSGGHQPLLGFNKLVAQSPVCNPSAYWHTATLIFCHHHMDHQRLIDHTRANYSLEKLPIEMLHYQTTQK
jgi:hypothetical protein